MSVSKSVLFRRQTALPEIGEAGQQKLQDAKVLVVGCGGLGSPIAVYLASSGIGKLHLIDFDQVDATNLHRQVFYELEDVGNDKSETLANIIKRRAPFTKVSFSTNPLTKDNVFESIANFDIIVDGTDSLPTKYLLNDACVLQGKPLVYGSLYKFDGYVASFNVRLDNGGYSANLRDAFPKMNTDVPNCEEIGTMNPIVGLIAMAQVNEVVKLITKIGRPLTNELLVYNALQNTQFKMKLIPNILKEKIAQIFKSYTYFDAACEAQNPDWQISAEELKKRLSENACHTNPKEIGPESLHLVAVLPNLKLPFKVHQTIPIQEFDVNKFQVDQGKTYVMVCQKGFNSYKATKQLKERYPEAKILNLTGGIAMY